MRKNDDDHRTAYLNEKGFKVIRFWNNEVFENLEGVLEAISQNLKVEPPSPLPSPPKGGEGEKYEP